MHVTPLMIGLAVLAVVILFGPKKLPEKRKKQNNLVDLSAIAEPQVRAGAPIATPPTRLAVPTHQFAASTPPPQAAMPMAQPQMAVPQTQYASIAPPPVQHAQQQYAQPQQIVEPQLLEPALLAPQTAPPTHNLPNQA
jgi:hypothetical protein